MSNKTLSLLLHMHKSDPAVPTRAAEGVAAEKGKEEAQGEGGGGKRCGDHGGIRSSDGIKEGDRGDENPGGVGEGKDVGHHDADKGKDKDKEGPMTTTMTTTMARLSGGAAGSNEGNVVVTVSYHIIATLRVICEGGFFFNIFTDERIPTRRD